MIKYHGYYFKSVDAIKAAITIALSYYNVSERFSDGTSEGITGEEFTLCVTDVYSDAQQDKSDAFWFCTYKSRILPDTDLQQLTQFTNDADDISYNRILVNDEIVEMWLDEGLLFPSPLVTNNPKSTMENPMSNSIKTTVSKTVQANKTTGTLALKVGVGRAANKAAVRLVKGKLPMVARGYADSPIGALVVANLTQAMIHQFAPTNEKALIVADAMLQAAMLDVVDLVDIDSLLDSVMDKVPGDKISALFQANQEDE